MVASFSGRPREEFRLEFVILHLINLRFRDYICVGFVLAWLLSLCFSDFLGDAYCGFVFVPVVDFVTV